ncbi:hypothetical protein [Shouchella clausii]|nr:hypothetical protein [Shouchella clausii]
MLETAGCTLVLFLFIVSMFWFLWTLIPRIIQKGRHFCWFLLTSPLHWTLLQVGFSPLINGREWEAWYVKTIYVHGFIFTSLLAFFTGFALLVFQEIVFSNKKIFWKVARKLHTKPKGLGRVEERCYQVIESSRLWKAFNEEKGSNAK